MLNHGSRTIIHVSVIAGDRPISFLDDDGLSVPSIACYEGAEVIAGREAKRRLDAAGLGVHGNIVRSPKVLLGESSVYVGGRERAPVDVVRDVVAHVKEQALRSRLDIDLDGLQRAVVTIPIGMNGAQRRSLRDAFNRAGITISQFIHEPFAAIYGLFRSEEGMDDRLRQYEGKLILVVDWGGGTLDLTLCRLRNGELIQLKNGGTDDVGGDRFDDALRNAAIDRYLHSNDVAPSTEIHDDARTRLLEQCESAKIELSTRSSVILYVPGFFRGEDGDFDLPLDRGTLESIVAPLISRGMKQIDELLARADVDPTQIAACVATGGMVEMPAVTARLHERFGPARVKVSDRSATLVSEGAAWVARDAQPLTLAKRVELRLARNSYLPVLPAGLETPRYGSVERRPFSLYCADPRDGSAKFSFCTPSRPGQDVLHSDLRLPLAELVVQVDAKAKPFRERLELELTLDDDLILAGFARSLVKKDSGRVELHDLEFGIRLPDAGPQDGGHHDEPHASDDRADGDPATSAEDAAALQDGDLVVRSNIADREDKELVPGELLHTYDKFYFDRRMRPPQVQVDELVYYRPCAICRRASNDPACRCGSRLAS